MEGRNVTHASTHPVSNAAVQELGAAEIAMISGGYDREACVATWGFIGTVVGGLVGGGGALIGGFAGTLYGLEVCRA